MGHGLNYDRAPLPVVSFLSIRSRDLLSLSRLSSYSGSFCGIHRGERSAPIPLFPSRLRDSDYNALREVDIVTDVMEPSTIFRDPSFEVREEKGKSPRLALYNRQAEFIVAPFESTRNQRS